MRKMHRDERGAALLTAMIIVTLVATLAAAMVWQQWRAVQAEAIERSRMQAAWILAGALDWARLILREDARAGGPDHLGEPWAVPLAEARLSSFLAVDKNNTDDAPEAFLAGSITDAQARYNLRNLFQDQESTVIPAELAILARLCDAAGVASGVAQRLANALAAANLGEDDAPLMPQSIAQLGWLGIDADTRKRLAPYVVLLPSRTPVNLNTASTEVIAAVVEGLQRGDAEQQQRDRRRRRERDAARRDDPRHQRRQHEQRDVVQPGDRRQHVQRGKARDVDAYRCEPLPLAQPRRRRRRRPSQQLPQPQADRKHRVGQAQHEHAGARLHAEHLGDAYRHEQDRADRCARRKERTVDARERGLPGDDDALRLARQEPRLGRRRRCGVQARLAFACPLRLAPLQLGVVVRRAEPRLLRRRTRRGAALARAPLAAAPLAGRGRLRRRHRTPLGLRLTRSSLRTLELGTVRFAAEQSAAPRQRLAARQVQAALAARDHLFARRQRWLVVAVRHAPPGVAREPENDDDHDEQDDELHAGGRSAG